jgi:hypothetical protein
MKLAVTALGRIVRARLKDPPQIIAVSINPPIPLTQKVEIRL